MGSWVHRTSKQHLKSVSPASLPEPITSYISEPDLSAVIGFPSKYWIIIGDVITLMGQSARDALDDQDLSDRRDSITDRLVAVDDVLAAFALVVLDEINTLRAEHSLPDRTITQLKTAVRGKLG